MTEPLEGELIPEDDGYIGSMRDFRWPDEALKSVGMRESLMMTKQACFLRAYSVRGIMKDGCYAAGVSRQTIVHWRNTDERFKELLSAAEDEARDNIEAEAHRRAVVGFEEPVIYQGLPTMVTDPETGKERMLTVRKYSDQLMAIMLKGARPEKYRENHKVQVEGGGATGILVVPGPISQEAWAEQAAIQQQKYSGRSGDGE